MKGIAVLVSFAVLMWLFWIVLRLPHRYVPPMLVTYLAAQCVFTLAGWFGGLQWGFIHNHYAQVYALTVAPVLGLAFAVLVSECWNPKLYPLIAVAVVATMGLFAVGRMVLPNVRVGLLQFEGALFIACGLCLLASLIVDSSPAWNRIRTGLGFFWLAEGGFHWFFSFGIVRDRESTIAKAYILPSLIAVIAFGWLAMSLSGLQSELSRESERRSIEAIPQPVNEGR